MRRKLSLEKFFNLKISERRLTLFRLNGKRISYIVKQKKKLVHSSDSTFPPANTTESFITNILFQAKKKKFLFGGNKDNRQEEVYKWKNLEEKQSLQTDKHQ